LAEGCQQQPMTLLSYKNQLGGQLCLYGFL